jgi:transposase
MVDFIRENSMLNSLPFCRIRYVSLRGYKTLTHRSLFPLIERFRAIPALLPELCAACLHVAPVAEPVAFCRVAAAGWSGGRENLIVARDYRPLDRDQLFLLPPDMRSWLSEDHFVWFLLAVVDQLDVSAFERTRRLGGVGRRGFDPRMLLALLIYGYACGHRSSRRIEDLCGTDVAFRVICAQDPPDHSTIARFRQDNTEAVESLFVQVLELAGQAGLGRVGVVAIDGTRLAANASHSANRRRSWLAEQVAAMVSEAEQTDQAEDDLFGKDGNPSRVDPDWCDPTIRAARITAALARAEQAAAKATAPHRARAAAAQDRVRRAEQKVADTWAGRADAAG